ncbi:flagellar protein FlaG [Bacillus salitolerans]|uniref:Flagellar protein FlaG n=1 Tax=Bacillus salitolerans TaxID=1437434 RepID=A0ABW4LNT1_9BACI
MEIQKTTPMMKQMLIKKEQPSPNEVEVLKAKQLESSLPKEEQPATEKKDKKEDLKDKVDQTNKMLELNYTSLKFEVHDETNRVAVSVVDQESKKVIREIPEKEFLDMFAKMMDYLGLLVDKKA